MLKNSKDSNSVENIVALILDEIGLAEASASNPLKVLHRLLEDPDMIPMIGLSNWSLDASKMNRVVFANRPILSEEELKDAAIAIWTRIFEGFDR
jgi:E3 ubiquitin-protein ligase RNF213